MFAMVSMMRINGVEISKKSKCAGKSAISKSFKCLKSDIHIVAKLEMMIQTVFAMVSMMRITGVEISKKSKCAKQSAFLKSLKTL